MKLTIRRGACEIGGSCVEIESERGSRILVDLGLPLNNPIGKDANSNELLFKEKHSVNVSGLYEWDLHSKPPDGLLLSHAHIDHYGLIRYIRKDICCFVGEASKRLIDITYMFTPLKGDILKYQTIRNGQPFKCGDIRITPFLMDHSAFDSYSFLIEAEGRKIIYSGDFREHGRKKNALKYFLHLAPQQVDALLLEGTMFGRSTEPIKNESDLEDEIVALLKGEKRITLLHFSSQNIDRFVTFFRAAKKSSRILVIDLYTAYILEQLKDFAAIPYPSRPSETLKVFYTYDMAQKIVQKDSVETLYKFKSNKISRNEIEENHANIMLMARPSLISVFDKFNCLNRGLFIYSMWDGYLKDNSGIKLLNFVTKYNMEFSHTHTSGHGSIETLHKVVKTIRPKVTIPIHTQYPEMYRELEGVVIKLHDSETINI